MRALRNKEEEGKEKEEVNEHISYGVSDTRCGRHDLCVRVYPVPNNLSLVLN